MLFYITCAFNTTIRAQHWAMVAAKTMYPVVVSSDTLSDYFLL